MKPLYFLPILFMLVCCNTTPKTEEPTTRDIKKDLENISTYLKTKNIENEIDFERNVVLFKLLGDKAAIDLHNDDDEFYRIRVHIPFNGLSFSMCYIISRDRKIIKMDQIISESEEVIISFNIEALHSNVNEFIKHIDRYLSILNGAIDEALNFTINDVLTK